MPHPLPQRPALLIIDMQVGLYHGPERPHAREIVLGNINQLIAQARLAQAPIFAVRHTGPDGSPIAAGSPYWQLTPELAVDPARDIVFDKTRPSCFAGTALAAQLAEAGCDGVVVVGMKTQFCIDTTCRAASELGLAVVLVADAHTCMDTPQLKAEDIIAHHNVTLAGPFANVLTTAQVRFVHA
ncbi:Nicotinamidase-related amidase [Andreprevotia lacus DSM 23236]|jgi:nicotinamidase-related amidase|uniref:Nicotinamidase-related amidase n=1 Tax=Andreprevotia lacus DSM 23236 TaxID=1121001 RepID=A0A1W1WXP2_9NEIS|nr:cysteine hydrolase family protein [Andreprevotia lacus]SMC16425.1 Nicotinamidase-related amidase [Andreprevotia lacus DSM 23236]